NLRKREIDAHRRGRGGRRGFLVVMLHDQMIVCFSSLSWDFLWLRHQELMARFARAGNRVLFVEPIGIRMPKWEDRRRIVARVQHRREAGTRGIREVMPNVWVLD